MVVGLNDAKWFPDSFNSLSLRTVSYRWVFALFTLPTSIETNYPSAIAP